MQPKDNFKAQKYHLFHVRTLLLRTAVEKAHTLYIDLLDLLLGFLIFRPRSPSVTPPLLAFSLLGR